MCEGRQLAPVSQQHGQQLLGWCHTSVGTHAEPPSGQRQREDERGYAGDGNQMLLTMSEEDGDIVVGIGWSRNKEKQKKSEKNIL